MNPSAATATKSIVDQAQAALARGEFVLLYDADGREEETDMVIASEFAGPSAIRRMRNDAGGLICTTLHPKVHESLGLPYMTDVLQAAAGRSPILGQLAQGLVPYEPGASKPSFGLSVNHRESFTGVTDNDRGLTIRSIAEISRMAGNVPSTRLQELFTGRFKSPGHVFLLNAHPKLLAARKGHTELATTLVTQAGLAPSATICEMMNGPSGRALPKKDAQEYAKANHLVFLEGKDLLEARPQP